jgi:hypothetical protein
MSVKEIKSAWLATVEEHEVGSDDRVFFGHQFRNGSEPVTEGTNAGWYYQIRGESLAVGPYVTKNDAEKAYGDIEK